MASALRANSTSSRRDGRRDLLLAGLLFAAVVTAYYPACHGGRLLDDDLHITKPELQSWSGLGRIWFQVGATQQYYPVLHTAFWLEHLLWGDAVTGYHLINILLHAGAALLVVALLRRLRLPGAWLAAFVFGLHPVCVESVAWIAEQKNTLSTVFALGAVIAHLHFDEHRDRSHYWLALGLFALALLSKTAVVTVPPVLLVVIWWRRGRLEWRRDTWPLLPWFLLGGAASLVTFSVERKLLGGVGANFELSAAGRLLVAGRALWFYAAKLVWPADLTFIYPRWTVDTAAGWQYIYPLAAAVLGAGLWFARRWTRGPIAAFLCFAGTIFPVLGFFNVEWFVFSYVADHLQYLALLGVIIPLAAALAIGAERLPADARRLAPLAGAALAVALGMLTWRQCGRYGDPVRFYQTAIALNPEAAAAYDNLGTVLSTMPGRQADAIAQYEKALELNPNVAQGHEDLATVLLQDPARRAEAAAQLETAVRLRPGRKLTHEKLAFALSGLPGRLPEAVREYRAALRLDPSDPDAHNHLGLALLKSPGGLTEAITEFQEALRLRPDFAEAHSDLGNAWSKIPGRLTDAIAEEREALRLKPNLAEAHNNLGLALAQSGQLDDAMAQFREAVRLKPDFAGAHNNLGLGWSLTPGRMNNAIAEFREALRLDPNFAPGWHSLGMACYRVGNLPAAAAAFRQELRLVPDDAAAREALAAATRQAEEK